MRADFQRPPSTLPGRRQKEGAAASMNIHYRDLTDGPVRPALRRLAAPAAIGMFCNTLFNITDTFFAGRLSTGAVAGLAISFPVFFAIISAGAGLGAGTTALIAEALGKRNREEARLLAAQALSFAAAVSAGLTLAGWFASRPLFEVLGARGDYLENAVLYIRVIFASTLFFIGSYAVNAALVAGGDTRTLRNVLGAGAAVNVVLDPWFMYGGFGVPPMGLAGIALATAVIQIAGFFYMLARAVKAGFLGKDFPRLFLPRAGPWRRIFLQGAPASMNHLTIGIGIFIITYFASRFGDAAVAAYGIATRVEQVVLLPVLGLTSGTLAIAGQNFGARHWDRIREVWRVALSDGILAMVAGGALVFAAAPYAMRWFTADPRVAELGEAYLRISAFALAAYAILFVTVSLLQALQRPSYAVWIGFYRQMLAPALLYPLLSTVYGTDGLWVGIAVVTWSAAAITLVWANRSLRVVSVG